jgi:IS5 family transposase
MQKSFSDLEYANKNKLTRRDRFLAEIEKVTPRTAPTLTSSLSTD